MKAERVQCTVPGCSVMVKKTGLKSHIRMKHEGKGGGFVVESKAQLADVTAKLTAVEKENAELKAQLADVDAKLTAAEYEGAKLKVQLADVKPATITDDDKKAILSDYLKVLTRETWEEIGRLNGYLAPAPVADAKEDQPEVTRRHVYLADKGLMVTVTKTAEKKE